MIILSRSLLSAHRSAFLCRASRFPQQTSGIGPHIRGSVLPRRFADDPLRLWKSLPGKPQVVQKDDPDRRLLFLSDCRLLRLEAGRVHLPEPQRMSGSLPHRRIQSYRSACKGRAAGDGERFSPGSPAHIEISSAAIASGYAADEHNSSRLPPTRGQRTTGFEGLRHPSSPTCES
jgi:hypothetical protein